MQMKAIMDFPYNGLDVKNGQEFEAVSRSDAEALRLCGRAELVGDQSAANEDPPKRKRGGYLRRDQRAA